MANPVSADQLIDYPALLTNLREVRRETLEWVTETTRLFNDLKAHSAQLAAEMKKIGPDIQSGKLAPTTDVIQRVTQLTGQYQSQREAMQNLSQTQEHVKQTTEQLTKRQEELLKRYNELTGTSAKVVAEKKRIAKELVGLSDQFSRLDTVVKKSRGGLTEISGTYNKLQKELTDTRNQLKSLDDAFDVNTGQLNRSNKEAVQLAGRVRKLQDVLKAFDADLAVHTRNVGNYPGSMGRAGSAVSSLVQQYIGFQTILAGLSSAIKVDSLDSALEVVTTDTDNLSESQAFLKKTADDLGVELNTLKATYTNLTASSKGTALQGKATDDIFKSVTTTMGLLKKPSEDTERALLAIGQMMSKGTVSAEELRGQLGDVLPGSFNIMAKALGVTTEKLGDMLKNGEVLAADALPKFAAELESTFNPGNIQRVEGLAASVARLKNEGVEWVKSLVEGSRMGSWLELIVSGAKAARQAISGLFSSTKDVAGESRTAFEEQQRYVNGLKEDIIPLADSYDRLSEKARQLGGETRLSGKEQQEMRKAIDGISGAIPSAISAQNEYGRVMAINTQVARDYVTEQERVLRVLNADSINKYNQALKLTESRITSLQQQLTLVQGATPTKPGEPAVSQPSNTLPGGATGTPLPGLSEKERSEQLARLRQELSAAKEEALDLQATINSLSGKGPDKKPSGPAAPAAPGTSDKDRKEAERKREEAYRKEIQMIRAQGELKVKEEENNLSARQITEAEFNLRRYNAQVKAANDEIAVIEKYGKKKEVDYVEAQQKLKDAQTTYNNARSKAEEDAWKKAVDALKEGLKAIDEEYQLGLSAQLTDLEVTYNEQRAVIQKNLSERRITEQQAADQLYNIQIDYLEAVKAATMASLGNEKTAALRKIDILKQTTTDSERLKDLVAIEDNLRSEDAKRQEKGLSDFKKKMSEETARKQIEDADRVSKKEEEEAKKRLQAAEMLKEKLFEISTAAVNGYFEVSRSYRDHDLQMIEKQKDYELSLVENNTAAKEATEKRFAAKIAQLRRKQAIADKVQAIFNIGINTAQAVLKNTAQLGLPLAIPVNIATVALGAIQAATVVAQKIPEFFVGKQNDYEGPAWVGERGFELIERRNPFKPQSTFELAAQRQIAYIGKHDKVYTHAESVRMIETDRQIAADIRRVSPVINPGRYAAAGPQPPVSQSMLTEAFRQAIRELPLTEQHWNDRGYQEYIRKEGQRVRDLNDYFRLPRSGK